MTKEEWKPIKGFENIYEISNYGFVKSLEENQILMPTISRGYFRVLLRDFDVKKSKRIHRLVAEHFIPNPDNKKIVNHKDGNKYNNHIDNLEWMTTSENGMHSYYELGHGNIRKVICYKDGMEPIEYPSISCASRESGVSRNNIGACLRGDTSQAGGFKWKYKQSKQ